MSASSSSVRISRFLLAAPFLAAALSAAAAQLDLTADAVLGKPAFNSGTSGTASASFLMHPGGLAEDPVTGELWVADENGSRVLRFSSAAAFANGQAANLVLGQADFTDTDGNRGAGVAANTLWLPIGVAVDQAGRVYVADEANNRILIFRPPFSNGMDAAEVLGQADFTTGASNRGGAVGANTLYNPLGIALDSRGNLYVADAVNNRVLKFLAPARTGDSAMKVFGQPDFTSNAPTTTATGLWGPWGVTVDAQNNVWVADRGAHRVVRYNDGAQAGDTTADLVLCQANFTSFTSGLTASTCNRPISVAVDLEGVAYVSDYENSRVLRFTSPATGGAASAVIGQSNFTSGACNQGLTLPTAGTLCNPWYAAPDRSGNLLVSDRNNARLLRYDLPRARVAPAISSFSPESMPIAGGAFTLTVNGSGFYGGSVVNWNGSPRATQYLSDRRLLAQVAVADIPSAGPFAVTVTTPTPGGGTSTLANFTPYARAMLDATADRVLGQRGFTTGTNYDPLVGEEQLGAFNAANFGVYGLRMAAVDPNTGRLFVADYNGSRVFSWPSAQAFHNAQAADVILGQPDVFTGVCNAGGISARTLCGAYGLAVDPAGALYVSDYGNNRVLRFVPPFSTGMAASGVYGQGGSFTTGVANNGGVSANSLSGPQGIAASATRLFVYDAVNRRILVYDSPATDFTADLIIGQPSLTMLEAASVSSTRLGTANDGGLAVDAQGNLWFANGSAHRVLRFAPPFANGMAADLVIGQPDFVSSAQATSATGLKLPIGIAFDPGGNLVVADFLNSRVLRYQAPLTSAMAATGVLGQAGFTSSVQATTASGLWNPVGLAFDRVGNLLVTDWGNARVLGFDRPFAFLLDPAADLDGDGMPNGVELTESRDPYVKDNDVFGNARLFARQQYRDFLNREGDEPGIVGWTNLVSSGSYTRPQVIDAFLQSQEFAGFVSPVVRLYFATFLRVPDYDGLTFNAGLVRNGTVTLAQLADFFTASPEFAATYGSLDNTAFVTLLYNNVLGRAPDPAGLSGWVSLLGSGYTRGQVLLGFSDSAEYQASMAHEVFVTMMYAGMLRRTPEPAGFNGWVGFLDAATYTREQVINGFFLSAEYRGRFLP